jgi:hypothetical protein
MQQELNAVLIMLMGSGLLQLHPCGSNKKLKLSALISPLQIMQLLELISRLWESKLVVELILMTTLKNKMCRGRRIGQARGRSLEAALPLVWRSSSSRDSVALADHV